MQPNPKALTRALALTGLCLGLPSLAFAVPMQLNHQGRLVDSSGIGLDGTGHTLTFSVYDDLTGGTAVWSETLSVPFTNGFYSAVLGTVDDCLEQLQAHLDAGVQQITLVPYRFDMEQIELIAEEIIPKIG